MIYNELGKTGLKVSRFGMGCMRLPQIELTDGTKGIDQEQTNEMIRYAIENGVNYFDTAYVYGGSEKPWARLWPGAYGKKSYWPRRDRKSVV